VEILMWLGAIQALTGALLAVLENDGRRLLSYHIISQVGYMVAAVGIGTAMAINGAVAHAACHIVYKGLLYMGASCILVTVGTAKFDRLGGLYKYMPIAFWLYMIGGFSISGFPLFSGFVSKGITLEAAELMRSPIIYLLLEGAAVGTFLHTGLKLPWNMWLQGKDEPEPEIRARLEDSGRNTPIHMLIAMGILAAICVAIGVHPAILYDMLPYPVEFVPYSTTRVFAQLQMFIFTFLGFWMLRKMVRGHASYTLDTDWLVRVPGAMLLRFCKEPLMSFASALDKGMLKIASGASDLARNPFTAPRLMGRTFLLHAEKAVGSLLGRRYARRSTVSDSRLKALRATTYDENRYRRPIGGVAALALLLLSLWAVINFWT
jgi:multicomponent Na+:H+ antiporter subunit D